MRLLDRARSLTLLACLAASVPHASDASATETNPANVAAARRHFEKARTLYGEGAYREAITELEAAHALDPNAKDLVFNLGVVHEKLGDIDDALKWFRLYSTMDLTQPERDRCDAYIRRLEGAKKEVEDRPAQQARDAAPSAPATSAPMPPPPPPTPNGRIDALTIGAAGLAGAGLVFGAVMGLKARGDQPPSTGRYSDLESAQETAHREAVMADVGWAVALVAGAGAAYLYFARSRAASSPATTGSTTVSAAPLAGGGGTFLVRGTF